MYVCTFCEWIGARKARMHRYAKCIGFDRAPPYSGTIWNCWVSGGYCPLDYASWQPYRKGLLVPISVSLPTLANVCFFFGT